MNEKLKYLTLFVIGMMLSLGMNAQSVKSISGTVTDDQGEAVISGTVKVKNGSTGTITDINGKYTLSVPSNATLVFSYIGYITQEFKVSELKSNVLNVVLQSDTKALDEVVVVGYGTMRKSDLTGSISTAKGKDMLKAQSFNALDGLKGKVAGVNIFSNTGQPGGESRVIIRGISTINASASPLYVVDGVVMSNFELLNPNDIESIEVLKDASSAAIYGARGANGVIMVTTKRGNAGKGVHVSYDGSLSIGKMARKIDVMDANEWMSTFKQGLENANEFQGKNFTTDLSQIFTDERLFNADGSPKYNTNWQDEASRTAISHNHQISIQRTGEGSSIGAFINYTDQQGILLNSYFKRINAKLAYDDKPTDWLSTSVNLLVNHTWGNRTSDNPYGQGALRTMIEQLPFLPVKLDGEYTQTNIINTSSILNNQTDPNSGKQGFSPEGVGNPVELLERMQAMQYRTQIFGNAALTFHLMKGLDLKTQFGIDYHNNRDANYTPFTPRPMINQSSEGAASANNSNSLYWQEETYLTYVKDINKHHINAMAGMSWQEYNYTKFEASDSKYIDDFYGYYNLGSGTNRPSVGNDYDKWAMNSYFLRLAYSYDNKYMATVTGRYDGSSKFARGHRWGFFPSFSAGYDIAHTDYFKNWNLPFSQLKIRVSYGRLGNQNTKGLYDYLGLVDLSAGSSNAWLLPGVNATPSKGVIVNTPKMVSPYITWEKVDNANLGIDLMLLNDRLSVTADIYQRTTHDMIGPAEAIPAIGGISDDNAAKVNNATLRNRGWELSVNWQDQLKCGFSYGIGFNLLNYKPAVTKYNNPEGLIFNNHTGLPGNKGYYEGMDLGEIWGYQADDLFMSNREVDEYLKKVDLSFFKSSDRWQRGDVKYIDSDGNGKVDPGKGTLADHGDLKKIGNATPKYSFGINLNAGYKGFEVSALFQGVAKRQFAMAGAQYLYGANCYFKEHLDYFSAQNPGGYLPRLVDSSTKDYEANAGYNTTRYLLNAAYMRLKNLTVSYNFKPQLVKNIGLSGLKVYFTCDNLFTVTKLPKQFDPETINQVNWIVGGSNAAAPGLTSPLTQNGNGRVYPMNRNFVFGIDVTL